VRASVKKSKLKELLLDRLRRKRKLVVDEMRSAIDIHFRPMPSLTATTG